MYINIRNISHVVKAPDGDLIIFSVGKDAAITRVPKKYVEEFLVFLERNTLITLGERSE